MSLRIVHLELAEANAVVTAWHRHHKPVVGHRFSVGVVDSHSNRLVGAAIVGRPVSRELNYRKVVEVTRLVTDGTRNACSILYAAAARSAEAMGYEKIQTYILESEEGTSLKAAGWSFEANTSGGSWSCDSRGRDDNHPLEGKQRWSKTFAQVAPFTMPVRDAVETVQDALVASL